MMLVEDSQPLSQAMPVDELTEHLRLGTGFSLGQNQSALLESFLQAAMSAIEGWTGKVLLARNFTYSVYEWRHPDRQALPVAPISRINTIKIVQTDGSESDMASEWSLREDLASPELRSLGTRFDRIPTEGHASINFTAGYGAAFGDIPADLRQAVLLLAAHYYEYRDDTALSDGCMPFGVTALLSRYRRIRVGLGA